MKDKKDKIDKNNRKDEKPKKERAEKYDPKLKVKGSFDDIIKAIVKPDKK